MNQPASPRALLLLTALFACGDDDGTQDTGPSMDAARVMDAGGSDAMEGMDSGAATDGGPNGDATAAMDAPAIDAAAVDATAPMDASIPNDAGSPTWPAYFPDYQVAYVEPTPTGAGVMRNIANVSEWRAAVGAAAPGDVLRITNTITGQNFGSSCLEYRGSNVGSLGAGAGADGTADNPIVITCAPGVWIDAANASGSGPSGLDIIRAEHVHVIGCNIRNARFGLRFITSGGSESAYAKIFHNEITNINEGMLYVGSLSDSGGFDSRYVDVGYNHVHQGTGAVEFNEGIYIGTGSTSYEWRDTTHHVNVFANEISNTRGDGIDIKPGVSHIYVFHNLVHDCSTQLGSGIGAAIGSPSVANDPSPGTFRPIEIYENWIYNFGYGPSGSSYGINANLGGMRVYRNTIWSADPSNTNNVRGINTAIYQGVSTHQTEIFENTVWVDDSLAYFESVGSGNAVYTNNITPDGLRGSDMATPADFVGPIPALNPGSPQGSADSGRGPGSAFALAPGSSIPTTSGAQ